MDGSKIELSVGFLSAIFGAKPAHHNVLIWQLDKSGSAEKKTQTFFTDLSQAAAFAVQEKPVGTDVYFGVGTLDKKPRYGRGKADKISGIGAVHLDVDIAHPDKRVHKKGNLPPDADAAIEFVNSAGVAPSIIVHSGFGLHVYWLLDTFWAFENDLARAQAASLIETWQRMFKWRAGHSKWDIDATQDLTRVLRLPGTLNYKLPDDVKQARLLQFNKDTRYSPAQFNDILAAMRAQVPPDTAPAPAGASGARVQAKNVQQMHPQVDSWQDIKIILAEDASLPNEIFEALEENVNKFKTTWKRQRKDLQDTSASSYDQSLANMAISAGLADQQVCNLLIAHRRKHGDEKMRLDYYQRTIFEAKAKHGKSREQHHAAQQQVHREDKAGLRDALQRVLGFKIEKIEKQLTDPPQFIVYFPNGRYKNMGDALGITDQNIFRRHIANVIGHFVPKMKDMIWEGAAQKLLDLAEDCEVSEDATELGEVLEILRGYIDEYLPTGITETQHRQYAAHKQPAILDGKAAVNALELWKYAKRNYGSKLDKKSLVSMLRRLGCDRLALNVRDERQKQCGISVYTVPDRYLSDDIQIDITRLLKEADSPE